MTDHDPARYAAFIQPAYAITVLTFLVLIVDSLWRARRWRRKAQENKPQ